MSKKQQTLPLDSDVNEIIESLISRTGQTKRYAGNELIRLAARVRRLPVLDKIPNEKRAL